MLQVLRALQQLSPAQRRLLTARRIRGEYAPAQLLQLLQELTAFDRLRSSAGGGGWYIATAVLFGLLGLALALTQDPLWLVLTLVAVIAIVVLVRLQRRVRALTLSANLAAVAMPFIATLKQDMASQQALAVDLDLSPPQEPGKRFGTPRPYKQGNRQRTDTVYRDAWFAGSAQLADGARLRWRVTEDIIESVRSRRNRRNKLKVKTRHGKRYLIALSLSLPAGTYGLAASRRGTADDRLSARSSDKRHTIKLLRKLKSRSLAPLASGALIEAVSTTYAQAVRAAGSTP